MTGSPYLYTVIFCWNVWNGVIGAISTAASGAFGMDILPSDEYGRPLNAARDMQFLSWASLITQTGFPILMGGALLSDTWTVLYWQCCDALCLPVCLIGLLDCTAYCFERYYINNNVDLEYDSALRYLEAYRGIRSSLGA